MNWAVFGLAGAATLALIWVIAAFRAKPNWRAAVTGIALLLVAGVNMAAPVRGAIDPNYIGYNFGLISAGRGLVVTLAAGSVLLLAAVGAFATLSRSMLARVIVAVASVVFLIDLGVPLIGGAIEDIDGNTIQFGEYLTVPGAVSTALMFVFGFAPFLIGLWWAARPQPAR